MTRMSDMMRQDYEKKKKTRDEKEILKEKFNEAALKGLGKFIDNINSDVIEVGSVTEAGRLFQIFMELNNLKEDGSGGSGVLPSLEDSQNDMFADYVEKVQVGESEDETTDYINPEAISSMTAEELSAFMNKREEQVNLDNESMG